MPLILSFNPGLMLAIPSAGNTHKGMERGSSCCLSACAHFAGKFVPRLALESTSSSIGKDFSIYKDELRHPDRGLSNF